MSILKLTSRTQLANYLRCQPKYLKSFFNNEIFLYDNRLTTIVPKRLCNLTVIRKFYIPKKTNRKEYRVIFSAFSDNYRNALKILNGHLTDLYTPPSCVHGFVRGKNIRTNAMVHLAKRFILSIDIHHFFETITSEMVEKALASLGYPKYACSYLSKFVTYNGFLVQGLSTSPLIANLVAQKLDQDMLNFAGANISYTRYADDLYFSSNDPLPPVQDFEAIVNDNGFKLNENKTKLMLRGNKQYVTGLTVFDKNLPRIPRKLKRNLRLEIYFMKKFGTEYHLAKKRGAAIPTDAFGILKMHAEAGHYERKLHGLLHFISSVEKGAAQKLFRQLKS